MEIFLHILLLRIQVLDRWTVFDQLDSTSEALDKPRPLCRQDGIRLVIMHARTLDQDDPG